MYLGNVKRRKEPTASVEKEVNLCDQRDLLKIYLSFLGFLFAQLVPAY